MLSFCTKQKVQDRVIGAKSYRKWVMSSELYQVRVDFERVCHRSKLKRLKALLTFVLLTS